MEFNPNLDFGKIELLYSAEQRIQLQNIWPVATANSISSCLSQTTKYVHAYTDKGQNAEISEAEIVAMSTEEQQKFYMDLYQDAYQGIGFLYGRHVINLLNSETPQILKDVFQYLNSDSVLEKIRTISGCADISSASAQATQYTPGNFLTRHNDIHETEGRRVAYVLGFTPKWHPDWGGLLQFYQQDGAPKDAWAPNYNSMSLFDVSHIHAVTFIAPFAVTPRLSITGWFRAH